MKRTLRRQTGRAGMGTKSLNVTNSQHSTGTVLDQLGMRHGATNTKLLQKSCPTKLSWRWAGTARHNMI